jgi:ABC-type branched-subunit amino acid transport system substrate-binding protein
MNTSLNGPVNTRRTLVAAGCLALTLGLAACGGGDDGGGNGPGSTDLNLVIGDELPLSGVPGDGTSSESTTTSEDTTTTDEATTGEATTDGTTQETTTSEETTTDGTTTSPGENQPSADSELGAAGEKASDLALDQIKSAIEDAGADHDVSVVHEDQGKDADAAVQAASKLVHADGATCLTGPWSAESFLQTAEAVAIRNKVLQISPTPPSEEIADLSDRDLVNSTALPVTLEGTAIAKAVARDLGDAEGYTVNVGATNDTYGDSLSEGFIESWQGQDGTVGGQVVIAPPPLDSSSSDFSDSSAYSSQVSEITSDSPDAVVLIVDSDTLLNLGSALGSSFGWDPETAWGSDELVVPGLVDEVGADVIGGMRILAPGVPKGEEASSAFVESFKTGEPSNVRLGPFASQEFDATILCYLAAVAAGSTDGQAMADELIDITAPGGEEFSWQELPDAIEALENGEDIDYLGASGPIDMDVRGAPTSGVYDIQQFTEEGLDVVGEVSVSKPNPAAP